MIHDHRTPDGDADAVLLSNTLVPTLVTTNHTYFTCDIQVLKNTNDSGTGGSKVGAKGVRTVHANQARTRRSNRIGALLKASKE